MQVRSRLYGALFELLSELGDWLDKRHLVTLVWMVVGLIRSERVGLRSWLPYVESRASYAQSTQRRFQRWLTNGRIEVNTLYGPLIEHALREWGTQTLYLALDTSLLFEEYCLIRVSVVYRGRAVPVVWKVLQHRSSTVSYETYEYLLQQAASFGGESSAAGGQRLCGYNSDETCQGIGLAFPDTYQM